MSKLRGKEWEDLGTLQVCCLLFCLRLVGAAERYELRRLRPLILT